VAFKATGGLFTAFCQIYPEMSKSNKYVSKNGFPFPSPINQSNLGSKQVEKVG
jgi:hypothetical protein